MTTEHLRSLLEDVRGMKLFSTLAALLAKAQIPDVTTQMIRVGRLTALSKPDGGVRTMALQLQSGGGHCAFSIRVVHQSRV